MFTIKTDTKTITTNGGNLLSILRENGIFLDSPCGGRGTCGKCKVYADGVLTLACRVTVDHDMTIVLPHSSDTSAEKRIHRRTHVKYTDSGFGLAFDIGTTTIAGCLVDLSDGRVIKTSAELNMQKSYGADVMSRVDYCVKNGTDELCTAVCRQLADMSTALSYGFEIKRTVIAANTVMSHIYMNSPLDGLAAVPFRPEFLNTQKIGSTILMPCISAYIGSDITASMLACDMDSESGTVLLLDLGTNGEMVLLHNGTYYCCSVSAGPALEGAGISCGTGSIGGAVCGFEFINSIPSVKTIDEEPSVGICGSGLIDIIAAFLKNRIIDEYGTFRDRRFLSPKLSPYLTENRFRISSDIYVTQKDIREFQTVKSAIYSGIIMLLSRAEITADDISRVYLCGGLGSNFNTESAFAVGLLPSVFRGKITPCGNTALSGAAAAVCDMSVIDEGEKIRNRSEIIELGGSPEFEQLFIENINF